MGVRLARKSPAIPTKRVCVAFRPDAAWTRQIIQGIRQYMQEHEPWGLIFTRHIVTIDLDENILGTIDGVFAGEWPDPAAGLEGVPVVSTEAQQHVFPTAPVVATDMAAVGALAAEHLLEAGFEKFAVFTTGDTEHVTSRQRVAGFQQALERAGGEAAPVFDVGPRTARRGRWLLADQMADLADFLNELSRPLGLFVVDVDHTWRAVLACQNAGVAIPDEVAIICGGDDDLIFDNLIPTVTGIQYDSVRVGYQAAAVLDRLMRGEAVEPPSLIPPKAVVKRGSTDFIPTQDADVRAAVRYIWQHVGDRPSVAEVAGHVLVSERTLQRKFQSELGRGPSDEIQTARLETAKRLLTVTNLPFIQVAARAGYVSQAQLSRYIRERTGLTPTQYRGRR